METPLALSKLENPDTALLNTAFTQHEGSNRNNQTVDSSSPTGDHDPGVAEIPLPPRPTEPRFRAFATSTSPFRIINAYSDDSAMTGNRARRESSAGKEDDKIPETTPRLRLVERRVPYPSTQWSRIINTLPETDDSAREDDSIRARASRHSRPSSLLDDSLHSSDFGDTQAYQPRSYQGSHTNNTSIEHWILDVAEHMASEESNEDRAMTVGTHDQISSSSAAELITSETTGTVTQRLAYQLNAAGSIMYRSRDAELLQICNGDEDVEEVVAPSRTRLRIDPPQCSAFRGTRHECSSFRILNIQSLDSLRLDSRLHVLAERLMHATTPLNAIDRRVLSDRRQQGLFIDLGDRFKAKKSIPYRLQDAEASEPSELSKTDQDVEEMVESSRVISRNSSSSSSLLLRTYDSTSTLPVKLYHDSGKSGPITWEAGRATCNFRTFLTPLPGSDSTRLAANDTCQQSFGQNKTYQYWADRFMLCDAGGGTVDFLKTYTVNKRDIIPTNLSASRRHLMFARIFDANRHFYKTLGVEHEEIRLLVPRTGRSSTAYGLPSYSLITRSLKASNETEGAAYDALSYVWGSPDDTADILVNDTPFQITRTLFDAISCLRASTCSSSTTPIWIDAICINQADISERNHQVSLMGQVYSKAGTVHIYLGAEGETTKETFRCAKSCTEQSRLFEEMVHTGNFTYKHLKDLFSYSWWSRLWVLQEVALATRPVVHCGDELIPFWDLLNLMVQAADAGLDGSLPIRNESSSHGPWFEIFNRVSYTYGALSKQPLKPDLMLNIASGFQCTSLHDRIYGVLGLMSPQLNIEPRYEMSTKDVFRSSSIEVMKALQTLRLLRLVRHTKANVYLQSWVPKFDSLIGLIGVHEDCFDATKGATESSFHIQEVQSGAIEIKAINIDEISVDGWSDPSEDSSTPSSNEELLHCRIRLWLNAILVHYTIKAIETSTNVQTSALRAKFWQTLLCDGLFYFVTGSKDRNIANDIDTFEQWVSADFAERSPLPIYLYHQLDLLVHDSWLSITKHGEMVMSRSRIRKGDKIALLGGEVIPYILRPSQRHRDSYHLIGSCYCSGIMYGEAINDFIKSRKQQCGNAKFDELFEKIILI